MHFRGKAKKRVRERVFAKGNYSLWKHVEDNLLQ
jgi:hypothetical protein